MQYSNLKEAGTCVNSGNLVISESHDVNRRKEETKSRQDDDDEMCFFVLLSQVMIMRPLEGTFSQNLMGGDTQTLQKELGTF